MSDQQYTQQNDDLHLRRDLGQQEDINDLDQLQQQYNPNDTKLKDTILFEIQGFGAIRKIKRGGMEIDAYIKGKHCQQSVKNLCKLLKMDNQDSPKAKLILAKYNIIQTDLLQLLLTQIEDKKLSFWIIALLAILTNPVGDLLIPQQRQILQEIARQYKKSFLRRQCLNTLIVHLADYFLIPKQQRKDAHHQMFEFIIVLIRNLLEIPNSNVEQDHLHQYFLISMVKQELFQTFLYLAQSQEQQLLKKINLYLLQIFYHTFTCFSPHKMYYGSNITINPDKMKYQKYKNVPTRNSRFNPNFAIVSKSGKITKVYHKLQAFGQNLQIKLDNVHQQKKPFRRVQLKKVEVIQHKYVEQNLLSINLQTNDERVISVKQKVLQYSRQFVEVSFSKMVKLLFDSIYRQEERVTQKHKIYYFVICAWAIQITRNKYYKERQAAKTNIQKGMIQLQLNQIAPLLQFQHFQLIFKVLYRQVTKQKRKDFKVNHFHAALLLFLEYLNLVSDMSLSMSTSNRKNANALMANMFRHDISRVLKLGFYLTNHQAIIQKMIIICYIFFRLLSDYSRGKVLTIQTNKMLKRKPKKQKKKKNEEMQMQEFISHDSNQDSDSQSYKNEQGKKLNEQQKKKRKQEKKKRKQMAQKQLQQDDQQEDDQNNPIFQQRKYNEMSQFSILAQYGIIQKHIQFLRNKQFTNNKPLLNTAIFGYIQKISILLKANWLFFQADTLSIFQEVLTNKQFSNKHIGYVKLLKGIVRSFIRLVNVNKLSIVQSLFKYQSVFIKENILKNYDNTNVNVVQQYEQNLFND